MKNQYNKTITACFTGYIVQAVVNNFAPLLFLFFQKSYQIPLSQITLLITFNFGVQLLVDLISVSFVDKIGYRVSMVLAHIFSRRPDPADDPAGASASSICRDPDLCNDLRHRRRAFRGSGQSGGGGLPLG